MSNPLDTEAGSELYSGYEADYKLVAADLNQQLDALNTSVGEQRKAGTNRAEATLAEAKELLDSLRVEAQNVPTATRRKLTAQIRNYESDLDKQSRTLTSLSSSRSALFGARVVGEENDGGSEPQYAQRQQLLSGTDRLNRSSNRIRDSQRLANETEEVGAGILRDLHGQRSQLENTHETLLQSEGYVDKSVKTLRGMARRMATNRIITIAIISLLVILIVAVIFNKFR